MAVLPPGADPWPRAAGGATPTQLSLLAELRAQSLQFASPLTVASLAVAGHPPATLVSYERRIAGLPTRLRDGAVLLPDGAGSPSADALARQIADTLPFDLATLRIAGPAGLHGEAGARSFGGGSVRAVVRDLQEALSLDGGFDGFFARLGRGTRRNVRDSRVTARQRGIRFHWRAAMRELPHAELAELCLNNMPAPKPPRRLASIDQLLSLESRPFAVELRDRDGQLISIAGGYVRGDLALMLYQFNHRRFRSLGPSLMLRTFLIEQLCHDGIRDLAFVGSCAGLLLNACTSVPALDMLIVRDGTLPQLKQQLCCLAQPRSRIARLSGGWPPPATPAWQPLSAAAPADM